MPVRLRQSKRRLELVSDIEYDTIRAGLLNLPCPAEGNAFAHLDAAYPSRKSDLLPKVRAVYGTLSPAERQSIAQRIPDLVALITNP